jgi:hypothetical protein
VWLLRLSRSTPQAVPVNPGQPRSSRSSIPVIRRSSAVYPVALKWRRGASDLVGQIAMSA